MDPSTLVVAFLFCLVLLAGIWWLPVLLSRVTAAGGADDGDPTEIATQIMAEANVFRGRASQESPPWDGVNRLAPPTQDGGLA